MVEGGPPDRLIHGLHGNFPQHGKSTGVHVYLPSAFLLTDSVHAVLTDLKRLNPETRKTFLAGSSLGGWTRSVAMLYCQLDLLTRSWTMSLSYAL